MLYIEFGNWDAVREKVVRENLLQLSTLNTLKRFCSEIISRLKTLSSSEVELLAETDTREKGYLLWIALCRRYAFIADFAVEVLRERYISFRLSLDYEDFDSFFNRKSEWHTELDGISHKTRTGMRQVLYRMLREADILTPNNEISPAMLSREFVDAVPRERRTDILYLPVSESDLRRMVS